MNWSNKKEVIEAVKRNGRLLKEASEELKANKEVVMEAIKNNSRALEYASAELRADKEVVMEAIKNNSRVLEYASDKLKADKEVVMEAIKNNGRALEYASAELKNDREVVIEAVKNSGDALGYASAELRDNKEVIIEVMKISGYALNYASKELQADKEVVIEAVKNDVFALGYASSELRDNKEVVIEAVKSNGRALGYASDELKNDREVVIEAIKNDVIAFGYASDELRANKEVVMGAIKSNGRAFAYASDELKADKEVVIEAVKRDGYALAYASDELKNDKEVVIEAVKRDGYALEYASSELRDNKEVIIEAVKKGFYALEYASEELKADKQFILDVVKLRSEALEYVSEELKNDKQFMAEATKYCTYLDNEGIQEYITNGVLDEKYIKGIEGFEDVQYDKIDTINIKVDNISQLDRETLEKLQNMININNIIIYEKDIEKYMPSEQRARPYNVEQYKKVLENIEEITSRIEIPPEDDEKREYKLFSQIYMSLGRLMKYDYAAIKEDLKNEYETETNSRNLYGGIVNQKAVCAGFAEILRNVCSIYNIQCDYMVSNTYNEISHAYNQVCIDGKWYNCDLTWDNMDIRKGKSISELKYFLTGNEDFTKGLSVADENYHTPSTDNKSVQMCNETYKDHTMENYVVDRENKTLTIEDMADGEEKNYTYNLEINGMYYCPENVIISNGKVHKLGEDEELIDYFVVNKKTNQIRLYDTLLEDSLINDLQDLEKIEIEENNEKDDGARTIKIKKSGQEQPIIIGVNKNNEIISYSNEDVKEVDVGFLRWNEKLEELHMPNLEKAKDCFLQFNKGLTNIDLPNLRIAEDGFLNCNEKLAELNMPNLEQVGVACLCYNRALTNADFPKLRTAKEGFLYFNEVIVETNMPNLEEVEDDRFKYIVEENRAKKENRITSSDIARLDKANNLTTTEIEQAGQFIRNMLKQTSKIIGKIKNTRKEQENDREEK